MINDIEFPECLWPKTLLKSAFQAIQGKIGFSQINELLVLQNLRQTKNKNEKTVFRDNSIQSLKKKIKRSKCVIKSKVQCAIEEIVLKVSSVF